MAWHGMEEVWTGRLASWQKDKYKHHWSGLKGLGAGTSIDRWSMYEREVFSLSMRITGGGCERMVYMHGNDVDD